MDEYIINSSTLLIKCNLFNKKKTKIYEGIKEFFVSVDSNSIILDSCEFYGCPYAGRLEASKKMLNLAIKLPIVIEDTKNIIFFPTKAFENDNCIWISFNNLDSIERIKNDSTKCKLIFKNNKKVEIDTSYDIIDRQIYNCLKLEKEMAKRREKA